MYATSGLPPVSCLILLFNGLFASSLAADTRTRPEERQAPGITPGFNAAYQAVSVSGDHAWLAPAPGDFRGPCPGLNAAANHNFLPRNGIVTISQAIGGVVEAFGMGVDLATLLALVGAFFTGDGETFSVGGPPPPNLVAGGSLGQPKGLIFSHNKFEGDSSPTRGDLYQFNNDYLLQMRFFQGMIDLPVDPDKPNYTLEPYLGDYSVTRYKQSVAENPYYFRGPVGFLIPPGTLALIYRMFGNKSAEYPMGFLSRSSIRSFFAVSGPDDAPIYQHGYERIPDNFYKRALDDEYTIAYFIEDVTVMYSKRPDDIAFGGNTGTVNSFTPLNIANLTGGVYNGETLLEGNNLGCFMYQTTLNSVPDLLKDSGIYKDVSAAAARFSSAAGPLFEKFDCPLADFNNGELQKYPGWTRMKGSGTY